MKLHPSQYTPVACNTTNPQYKEGCLRFISVKHLITERTEIHPIYQAIGTIAEERYLAKLDPELFVDREVSFSHDLEDDVFLSGRVDFLLPDRVDEVKASMSAAKRSLWRKGQPDPQHLGQLVTYLVAKERTSGVLHCSYVHFNQALDLSFEDFIFNIRLDATGHIWLNDVDFAYGSTVSDILAFYRLAKEALIGPALPPMPMTSEPCRMCPFQAVCTSNPQDRETFHRQVSHVIDEGLQPVGGFNPTIRRHNRQSKG